MQRVFEYRNRSFWSSRIDLTKLNDKLVELNRDGWTVKSVTPNSTLVGIVLSYTIFMERPD